MVRALKIKGLSYDVPYTEAIKSDEIKDDYQHEVFESLKRKGFALYERKRANRSKD